MQRKRQKIYCANFNVIALVAIILFGRAPATYAVDIFLPSTAIAIDDTLRRGSTALPTGPYSLTQKPSELVGGDIHRRAWRIDSVEDSFSFFEALRDSIVAQDFTVSYECGAIQCGGFDFRYGIDTAPPPDFLVDVDEFYYSDLRHDEEIVTILVSPVGSSTYVQILEIEPSATSVIDLEPLTTDEPVVESQEVAISALPAEPAITPALPNNERVVVDVSFDVGGTAFSSIDDAQLSAIAETLANAPSLIAYVVGHSDQSGSLSVNKRITLARAQSVRNELINNYGVAPNQLIADGVAFLAPIASNATETGRDKNRRVEIVFLEN